MLVVIFINMLKIKLRRHSLLKQWIGNYGKYRIDGGVTFCQCAVDKFHEKKVLTETTFKCKCHIATIKQFSTPRQTLLTQRVQTFPDCNASY
jgi:hypothetical protein